MPGARVARQAASFAVIGVASTVFHLGLFALLRQGVASAALANAIALLVATIVNTAWNRRWTFGLRGREGAGRQQVQALVVLAMTLALTTAGLGLLHTVAASAPTWLETAAVAMTTILSTAVKFVLMRTWIFAPPPTSAPGPHKIPQKRVVRSAPSSFRMRTTIVERHPGSSPMSPVDPPRR